MAMTAESNMPKPCTATIHTSRRTDASTTRSKRRTCIDKTSTMYQPRSNKRVLTTNTKSQAETAYRQLQGQAEDGCWPPIRAENSERSQLQYSLKDSRTRLWTQHELVRAEQTVKAAVRTKVLVSG
eukprot:5057054-Amphidinium_carterae.2